MTNNNPSSLILKIGRRVNNSTTDYSLIITSFLHLRVWLNAFERKISLGFANSLWVIHVMPGEKEFRIHK